MKKTLMYMALLLVSGVVFSACIPKQEEKAAMDEAADVMVKEDAMDIDGDAMMVKDDSIEEIGDEMEAEDEMMEEGRVISMEMGGFYYEPNVIEAEAGETITVEVENVDGFHDFVIDELDVATEQINEGNTVTATFTIPEDASGAEYEFYCSVGNHSEQGMVGTLMVK